MILFHENLALFASAEALLFRFRRFSSNFKIIDLTTDQLKKLTKTIETSGLIITTELKKKKSFALKELVNLKTYRGIRRIKGLPVRGQRTHTNGKTAKLRRS